MVYDTFTMIVKVKKAIESTLRKFKLLKQAHSQANLNVPSAEQTAARPTELAGQMDNSAARLLPDQLS